jgi:hypothetical protein
MIEYTNKRDRKIIQEKGEKGMEEWETGGEGNV